MKKTLLIALLATGIFLLTNSFKKASSHQFSSSGAAAAYGSGYTGAAFDNGSTCANCHGGGNYNATLTATLLSSGTPVTNYIPGNSYTLRLVIGATGTPRFGFQITCASSSGDANINGWGAVPAGTQNTLISGPRNYVEHTQRLTSGTIDLPWTAPATATGNITFYAIGNAVNGAGSSGDNPTAPLTLTISESTLPIQLASFEATKNSNGILLNWTTAQEQNHKKFEIEHSTDGTNFTVIGEKVSAEPNSALPKKYQYLHQNITNGSHFYRLKNVDVDNRFSYSSIVNINWSGKGKTSFVLSPNVVSGKLTMPTDIYLDAVNFKIVSQTGAVLLNGKLNTASIDVSNIAAGSYFLVVETKDGESITGKFIKL